MSETPIKIKVGRPTREDQFKKAREARRNDLGLVPTLTYCFDEMGGIDWRKMIPERFLFVNTNWFETLKKDVPESVKGLSDEQVLIRLGGLKWAAKARGFCSVYYDYTNPSPDKVVVRCTISWIPNYEGETCVYSEIASVSSDNADSFGKKYAETVAANRAFGRCVRSFLNINIVSDVELKTIADGGAASTEVSSQSMSMPTDPMSIFIKSAHKKFGSLEKIIEFSRSHITTLKEATVETEDDLRKLLTVKDSKKLLAELKRPQTV